MEPEPRMYKDIFYDSAVTEALESLKLEGLIEGDSQFLLTDKGKEKAQFLLTELSDQERGIFKQIIDLFKNASVTAES